MDAYVLITAARNEQDYIERTLSSVVSQTLRPLRWIIVNDGSTDRTADIVKAYCFRYPFVHLISVPSGGKRTFEAKSRSVNMAFQQLADLTFGFVGNLDADVAFESRYCEKLVAKFKACERLGLAGGRRYDWTGKRFVKVRCAPDSAGGPFQFFRRECFESIGGYLPLPYGGGEDTVAEVMIRMSGWKVRTFSDLAIYHHRLTGKAKGSFLKARFHNGIRDYLIGYHPIFELLRCVRGLADYPYLSGGLAWWLGYLYPGLAGWRKRLPHGFVAYLRREQRKKLLGYPSALQERLTRIINPTGS